MGNREELKKYITEFIQYIIQDCKSFIYIRLNQIDDYRNHNFGIGGGNILMALGLFSTLGYLSKIFVILSKDNYKKNKWGDINETEAFLNLMNITPHDLGFKKIGDDNIRKQWRRWRHKLVHLTVPQGQIQACDAEHQPILKNQYQCYLEQLKNLRNKNSFNLIPNFELFSVDIDKLVTDVEKISLWVIDQIKCCRQERVDEAVHWIERELEK